MSIRIEGTTVNVGDCVGFKCDIEQSGEIVKIKRSPYGKNLLVLKSHDDSGFEGHYIGGDLTTEQLASDCWVD